MNPTWEDLSWSTETHWPGRVIFVVLPTCLLAAPFLCQGLFVISAKHVASTFGYRRRRD